MVQATGGSEDQTLSIREHGTAGYAARTRYNAEAADLTAAFAVNLNTAGERLTKKAAGDRYVAISLGLEPLDAARSVYRALRQHDAHVLNVAGNGLYTLILHGWTQETLNVWLLRVLAKVAEHWPIAQVISGGQTGVDVAGLVAATALHIQATGTLSKGFVQRSEDGVDFKSSAERIRGAILHWANLAKQEVFEQQ